MYVQLSHPSIPPDLTGPCLLDINGLPRYWVTAWAALTMGALSYNTKVHKLRHVESLYAFADDLKGHAALDIAIGRADADQLAEILEGYFVSLRNKATKTESDEARWRTGLEFVKDTVSWLSKSSDNDQFRKAEKRFQRLGELYQQLHVSTSKRPNTLRSLPANVVAALYDMLDPLSASNPFKRKKTRWLAYVTFVVLLHQGLRRGELLLQPTDSIKSAFDKKKATERYWLNVQTVDDENTDPRSQKPSIKTSSSIRQIPVSEFISTLVQTYTENYRGRPNHPFLLNSARNTPLSLTGISALFKRISAAMPETAMKELFDRTGKTSITPHDLRHTCAVIRLNQMLSSGVGMDEALQRMRVLFGWSRLSDMPRKYARATFEDRQSSVWSAVMDDRAAILRAVPKGV